MKLKIDRQSINADWCPSISFKGGFEDCKSLCEDLEKKGISYSKKADGDNWIISFGGYDVPKIMPLVKKHSGLKACAFLDEFDIANSRNTYVVYSEKEENKFSKIIFIGTDDAQNDLPFSEMADLLQTKEKHYPVVLTSSGHKSTISYSFPFRSEWEI